MLRVGNFFVSISVEGFEEANDGRRGNGHFQKALDAMELRHSHRIPFGVSICYTSQNYKVVTSDDFLDLLISKGCVFAWYFHYMPVGINASTDLLLTPEQRTYMKDRVREIRGATGALLIPPPRRRPYPDKAPAPRNHHRRRGAHGPRQESPRQAPADRRPEIFPAAP